MSNHKTDDRLTDSHGSQKEHGEEAPAVVQGLAAQDAQHGGRDLPEALHGWEPDYEPQQNQTAQDWRDLLLKGPTGRLKKDSLQNAILLIQHLYGRIFVLNLFSDEIWVVECPPWEDPAKFQAHRLGQDDIIRMTALLEYQGLSASTERANHAIMTTAKKNAFHPVRRYFDCLKWDGKNRLHYWLKYYLGASAHSDYLGKIGTIWMVAAVKRIFEPGCKFDHMLVLEGPQNRGKSRALRTLATFAGREYFCDTVPLNEIGERSAVAAFQGKMIIEFQELDGINKKDIETLKRWITLQADEVQKKYENAVTLYPRQFVLAGTTNEEAWLRDTTGNRRYWPVRVNEINIPELKQDAEQLWAEAIAFYKSGYQIWIADNDPVYDLIKIEQAKRLITDVWENLVLDIVEHKSFVTVSEVLIQILDKGRHDKLAADRIRGILKTNGWESCQQWHDGKNVKGWKKEKKQKEMELS